MEEDSKWRSEEEEGEEEKGLMAFPLIAPLPTFIPTLHPRIQPPAPAWPSRRGPWWRGWGSFPTHGQGDRAAVPKGWWPPDPPWPCHHAGTAYRAPSLGVMHVRDLCTGDTMVPKAPPCPCTSPPRPTSTQDGASFATPGAVRGGGGLPWGPVQPDARGCPVLLQLFAASPQQPLGAKGREEEPPTPETHGCPWAAAPPLRSRLH